jgi:hypothetical protein
MGTCTWYSGREVEEVVRHGAPESGARFGWRHWPVRPVMHRHKQLKGLSSTLPTFSYLQEITTIQTMKLPTILIATSTSPTPPDETSLTPPQVSDLSYPQSQSGS